MLWKFAVLLKLLEIIKSWDGDEEDSPVLVLEFTDIGRAKSRKSPTESETRATLQVDDSELSNHYHNILFQIFILACITFMKTLCLKGYTQYAKEHQEHLSKLAQRKIPEAKDTEGKTRLIVGQMKCDGLEESLIVGILKNGEYYKRLSVCNRDERLERLVKSSPPRKIKELTSRVGKQLER